ncbi:hypothetical protein [Actinomadura alba]|uniref:Uncharacterized protein n=1 Tax=Actinomadura alba TaxID=406431 RepID=A0ABR7LVG6_9ACTN|nr:hypothetical protein [Actinomadura alba]MBC6468844.1 hypothetical protein [Actinomadura alba]
MKALLELLGFMVERLTGTRKKGARRLPRDSRRSWIVGAVVVAGLAGALAIYGFSRAADPAPSSLRTPSAAPTAEGTPTVEGTGSPEKPIRSAPARATPTTGRQVAEGSTADPEPTRTETQPAEARGVRKGASCSAKGTVGYTDSGKRVTCQGPGRLRWR